MAFYFAVCSLLCIFAPDMKNLGNMNYKTINWIARQTATALALLCLTITMSAADGDRFLVPVPLNGTGSTIMRFTVLSEAENLFLVHRC